MVRWTTIVIGASAFVALVGGGLLDIIAVGAATTAGVAIGSREKSKV